MSNLRFWSDETSLPATQEVRHGHWQNGAVEPEELHERTPTVGRIVTANLWASVVGSAHMIGLQMLTVARDQQKP